MKIKTLAFLTVALLPVAASAAVVPLTQNVCIRYADLTEIAVGRPIEKVRKIK